MFLLEYRFVFLPAFFFATSQIAVSCADGPDFDAELATKGMSFLETYCKRCHGVDQKYPGLDVLNRETLLKPLDESEDPFIVVGSSETSRLWDAVDSGYMPPERQKQPSSDDVKTFKQWIDKGAHFPPVNRPKRDFRGEETVLAAIENDIRDLREDQVVHARYFSLAHLWNDISGSEPTTDDDLQLIRAALSKLINSLSTHARVVPPRLIDEEFGTVLAIDLRDYGWTEWHWNEVLKLYPYGLKVSSQSATNIHRQTDTRIPYLRADWFVATASRPPLYHLLLDIPVNAKALEESLGVNISANFQSGRLARAAFQKSGVSQQNRMVERHDPTHGAKYYWKSYDIKPNSGEKGDFTRRPLGPLFQTPGESQLAAFEHDGGEIIWSLPNGLQAYMLVAGDDQRIDVGPPEVVFDPNGHGGSVLITNGISCMGCHKHGMFPLGNDEIRPLFERKQGQQVADKVIQLYRPNDVMRNLVQRDESAFIAALTEAIMPFLAVGENENKPIEDFPEPITKVSNRYLRSLDASQAARELGLSDQSKLTGVVALRLFRDLGLGNWSNDQGTVPREIWEKAYGRLARELEIGIPIRVR